MSDRNPSDRKPPRVLEALLASQWAITDEALERMVAIAERTTSGNLEAIEKELGRPLANTRDVTVRDGVALIPISGPMFRYANLFVAISGATSYELLSNDIAAAMASPAVRAVLFDFDSPGGEVNGVAELAALLHSYRGTKPMVAYVSGAGASAAYWLASAADEIVANETAILGCLGCKMTWVDSSARDEKNGTRKLSIVSSQTPRKAFDDPNTKEGREALQATVDALAEVFIENVAAYRGVSRDAVVEKYGQGGVFVGRHAVEAGLADRLGTLESVHAELASRASRALGAPSIRSETRAMSDKPTPAAEQPKDTPAPTASAPAIPAPVAAAPTAAPAAETVDLNQVRADAAKAERERILGIDALTKPGTEALAAAAKADGSSPEVFAKRVLEAEREKGKSHLASLKADEDQLRAPTPRPTSDGAASAAVADTTRILATARAATPNRVRTQGN